MKSLLDDTDRELLRLLNENARISIVDLSKKLRVSRATVQNRMKRLEEAEVILGYTLRQKPQGLEHDVRAIMCIEVKGHDGESVRRELRGNGSVAALYSTNGHWDLIADLRTNNLERLDQTISRIRKIDGVTSSQTHILLSIHKL